MRWTPIYLVHGFQAAPDALVCVLTLGLPPLRIGLVHRGPLPLGPGSESAVDRIESLLAWARQARVAFLERRFQPKEEVFPEPVALIANATRYRLWKAAILPLRSVWPRVRQALRRL